MAKSVEQDLRVRRAHRLPVDRAAASWIFQDGHFASLLGFPATGTIDVPILMFCMAFGLSMDYEVFIVSRIKESYERTHDSDAAVVAGLSRTGGLVTLLALIIAVVLCFATSGVTFIMLMGLGLAVAMLMDATVVRGLLVPALMRLTRSVNWWAPRAGCGPCTPDSRRLTSDPNPWVSSRVVYAFRRNVRFVRFGWGCLVLGMLVARLSRRGGDPFLVVLSWVAMWLVVVIRRGWSGGSAAW